MSDSNSDKESAALAALIKLSEESIKKGELTVDEAFGDKPTKRILNTKEQKYGDKK